MNKVKYYLVEESMLPEICLKVLQAKELLQTGEATTVADAAVKVGISRSAFYKYKDAVTPFRDLKSGQIITFHVAVRDEPGALSDVLHIFGSCGANILTINQSIPVDGVANVTVSADTAAMDKDIDGLLNALRAGNGVVRAGILAG